MVLQRVFSTVLDRIAVFGFTVGLCRTHTVTVASADKSVSGSSLRGYVRDVCVIKSGIVRHCNANQATGAPTTFL